MVLEVAILEVKPGEIEAFETAFRAFSTKPRFWMRSNTPRVYDRLPFDHELKRCLEKENRYLLLVRWVLRSPAPWHLQAPP